MHRNVGTSWMQFWGLTLVSDCIWFTALCRGCRKKLGLGVWLYLHVKILTHFSRGYMDRLTKGRVVLITPSFFTKLIHKCISNDVRWNEVHIKLRTSKESLVLYTNGRMSDINYIYSSHWSGRRLIGGRADARK